MERWQRSMLNYNKNFEKGKENKKKCEE